MINFHVGQEVVCVNNTEKTNTIKNYLIVGKKYTIRWIGPYNSLENGQFKEIIAVKVVGVTRSMIYGNFGTDIFSQEDYIEFLNNEGLPPDYYDDAPFAHWRFKPLEKNETSMDILKGLLNSSQLPEGDDDDGFYNPTKKEKVLEDVK